jgi:hypothetical protein
MVTADIDFKAGTITLRCPRWRRKHVKPVEETKSQLSIKCKCDRVISWESDLTWVQCYAFPCGATIAPPNASDINFVAFACLR